MTPIQFYNQHFQPYFDRGDKQIPANKKEVKLLFEQAKVLFYSHLQDLTTREVTYMLKNNMNDFPICRMCDSRVNITKKYGLGSHCSDICRKKDSQAKIISSQKSVETTIKRYGKVGFQNIENIEKAKNAMVEKYGVDNIFKCKEGQELVRKGLFEKYGVEHNSYIEKTIQKRITTNILNSGESCCFKLDEVKNKAKLAFQSKIFVTKLQKLENMNYKVISEEPLILECDKGHRFVYQQYNNYTVGARCLECYPWQESKMQVELSNFVTSLGFKVLNNHRKVLNNQFEIDVYIPSKKLGIEYNGDYWHSASNLIEDIEFSTKHIKKLEVCLKKEISLLQFRDIHWLYKQEIVKSIIKNKLGLVDNKIYARKCNIKQISTLDSKIFLENNHIQGSVNAKIKLGLFYNDELVQVMTFGKPRFNKNYEYELLRLASKTNLLVIGGASKLFNYFIKNFNPNSIISYADRNYSEGKVYQVMNMKYLKTTKQGYIWIKKGLKSVTRYESQKHKLKQLLGDDFNPSLSESENMYNNGYSKLYDSGQLVYEWNN